METFIRTIEMLVILGMYIVYILSAFAIGEFKLIPKFWKIVMITLLYIMLLLSANQLGNIFSEYFYK